MSLLVDAVRVVIWLEALSLSFWAGLAGWYAGLAEGSSCSRSSPVSSSRCFCARSFFSREAGLYSVAYRIVGVTLFG